MGKVNKHISVERLQQLKQALEKRIVADVQAALADFESAAGFTPSAIDVHLLTVEKLGDELPDHLVAGVTVRLDVLG